MATGYQSGTTTLARTPDGLAWAVVVTTQRDTAYEYVLSCDRLDSCVCAAQVTSDASTATLRLFRLTMDLVAPVEVLSLPFQGLELIEAWGEFGDNLVATHAQAFGQTLAIGLRVQHKANGAAAVRALRIDLDTLAP